MKAKIIFSVFLVTVAAGSFIFLFEKKISKDIERFSAKSVQPAPETAFKNNNEGYSQKSGKKIFSQIEKWLLLKEAPAPKKETSAIETKKEIIKKVESTINKFNKNKEKTSQEKTLLEEFNKELTVNPGGICAGRVEGATTSGSNLQNCEGGANANNCADENGHYGEKNLDEEGGWGYSEGGEDSTDCCKQNSSTQKCGKGDIQVPGKCQYSGDIYTDGPIINNVQCCSGCCVRCSEHCCSDYGCCVASCEKKCKGRGYRSYIWNSVTKQCGCAN